MDKRQLKSEIASAAYSIGYGSKVHQATLDMAAKIPGWINFVSLAIGIVALIYQKVAPPVPAATLLIAGVGAIYFSYYQERQDAYDLAAKELLKRFYQLQDLALEVDAIDTEGRLRAIPMDISRIREEAKTIAIARQVFLASWYAHYKFFWQAEIGWLLESRQPPLRFWRDKMPLGATVTLLCLLGFTLWWAGARLVAVVWCAP